VVLGVREERSVHVLGGAQQSPSAAAALQWMIMEFCEKGSLERAVSRGTFIRSEDRKPEMVSILTFSNSCQMLFICNMR
jgi:hypothetical protein